MIGKYCRGKNSSQVSLVHPSCCDEEKFLKDLENHSSKRRKFAHISSTKHLTIIRSVPIANVRDEFSEDSLPMRISANFPVSTTIRFSKITRTTVRIPSRGSSNRIWSPNNFPYNLSEPKSIRIFFVLLLLATAFKLNYAQNIESTISPVNGESSNQAATSAAATCFGGLQTFEKISMSTFESPSSSGPSSFGSGILIQQDDQALTSECVNLCRSQSNCLSFVIDYNKFECKSYATTQQELQQEFDSKFQAARSVNSNSTIQNRSESNAYQASESTNHFKHLLPSASSNYFEKICLDGVANRNQFSDVCGRGRLWIVERVVDSFLDGYVEKEVTNVNSKDECGKLCIFETQFVCRSADYDQRSRLCRLSKEDRRTQPQAMRYAAGSNRQYLENQCATPGPSSCVYETKKNVGIISMDALKFAQTVQDCQMKCNQESTFNCRSYSFHQQRCFLSGDDSSSLNSHLIKLPTKQGWQFGEKKCLVELCTKGVFSYEKVTGHTLRSALSSPIDLMMPSASSSLGMIMLGNNLDDLEKLQHESSQTKLRHLLPIFDGKALNSTSNLVSTMMMMASNSPLGPQDPLLASATSRYQRSASNLAITNNCRHSCDLGYLNCPAFTIDYKNNRCQRLDRNSQGRHQELVARDGFAYFEKICLRVPEIMTMCQDKYWIFERVLGYELAPRLYDKSLKFVQSRRDCEEYCLEEKQFQCRSALYNDEVSECKLSRYDRRLANHEGGYYRNFNTRISYLENQCIRDHSVDEQLQCYYEQAKDEPSYPTFTEHIEMVQPAPVTTTEVESTNRQQMTNRPVSTRYGYNYCEQLCNDNARFECHSFGYYASTAQCFLSGDDSTSAGESATTSSTGFTYFEKKCRFAPRPGSTNQTTVDDSTKLNNLATTTPTSMPQNPYFQTNHPNSNAGSDPDPSDEPSTPSTFKPTSTNITNNQHDYAIPPKYRPIMEGSNETAGPDKYKCGIGHTFVYQRVSGFEPIGGYLTLLIKNNDRPGIVAQCSELCKKAYECRAFIVDYVNNQCFAMLENSSIGMLNLRQILGKDYFEGFCLSDHLLASTRSCQSKTWIVDKIVDQAVVGVQHQKVVLDVNRVQCRQACLEERLFWCKSAMFDSSSGECKLYSIDRESMPQMRLVFTKGVDFFENQCQINSNSCPYDAIERDMTIVAVTKSTQARSTFDCEHACNTEITFNCRSYTYLDQYPSLPNLCFLSSDSRSTSQKGSVKEQSRTLYAERNCYYRRPRYPGSAIHKVDTGYSIAPPSDSTSQVDPYQQQPGSKPLISTSVSDDFAPPTRLSDDSGSILPNAEIDRAPGQGCSPHQFTFERTFGYDFRLAQKERAPIAPTIGIAIGCQQECLRRGERCQSFVVEYGLPFQSCFLMDTQVGSNRKLLVKSINSVYFEKICLPRIGVVPELPTHAQLMSSASNVNLQSMDISPSYSNEPWSPQIPNKLPYYLQQQQLVQNYPSRTCAKLWSFERFINHNFTATSDKIIADTLTKAHCEMRCLNEASFTCRSATYDYDNRLCRLFKNTRRTIMSQFIDLDATATSASSAQVSSSSHQTGSAQVIPTDNGGMTHGVPDNAVSSDSNRRARLLQATTQGGATDAGYNIDYLENTCVPEPSSCQYRQLYDLFSTFIDKMNHAVSLSDCQRQCDRERLFSCKSINYDPASKSCMMINEDLISLNRGQQAPLLPKKNTVYSEKGNCEMISVQCNPQEMLVAINFDTPFRGRIIAKGNPEQCFLIGDGQTSIQFPIVFGPKCNSRQEGHNTFVNEVVIQQHPVIMTDSDKTVRVMCAFEAPDQTITLKNPNSSENNKSGIDVGTSETSRTRHDKQHFNSVVSNKASPPSVLLRILDPQGRDASMINLGDDLMLRIQMQMDGQNSALGIFARNLAARSSNGESLLLIDNDGCPVDPLVFPALEIDPKDNKSLISNFKAFRFPSSGLVNFEVQIRFCPERCQSVECHKGNKMNSYGRRKRDTSDIDQFSDRMPIIQSAATDTFVKNPIDSLSTVMKPGKAFQYVRELLFTPTQATDSAQASTTQSSTTSDLSGQQDSNRPEEVPENIYNSFQSSDPTTSRDNFDLQGPSREMEVAPHELPPKEISDDFVLNNTSNNRELQESTDKGQPPFQKSILMHVNERVVPSTIYSNTRAMNQPHSMAPYGRVPEIHLDHRIQSYPTEISSTFERDSTNTASEFAVDTRDMPDSLVTSATPMSENKSQDVLTTPLNQVPADTSTSINNLETIGKLGKSYSDARDTLSTTKEQAEHKDMPLRFSILVGENQNSDTNNWTPNRPDPMLVMNSTNVDLDHIVIPGRDGQLDSSSTSDSRLQISRDFRGNNQNSSSYQEANYLGFGDNKFIPRNQSDTGKREDQMFDALSSNSVAAEVKANQPSDQYDAKIIAQRNRQDRLPPESSANRDCQVDSSSNKLWTIIWTGTFVIVINICLVTLSLVLYFKRVHLRQNHDIMRATSDCGTHSSDGQYRWPSVLLKSKNNLATSLNTHEHFFCKLNSKPTGSNPTNRTQDFNWPNLSTSSSHSTISSMASPLPLSGMQLGQARTSKLPFDTQSTLRNNFNYRHKSILDINSCDDTSNNLHASYTPNIDESHPDSFQNLR